MSAYISAAIKSRRQQLGWTQSRLAGEAGVSRPTVTRVEGGQDISATTLAKIAHALGLELRLQHVVPEGNG